MHNAPTSTHTFIHINIKPFPIAFTFGELLLTLYIFVFQKEKFSFVLSSAQQEADDGGTTSREGGGNKTMSCSAGQRDKIFLAECGFYLLYICVFSNDIFSMCLHHNKKQVPRAVVNFTAGPLWIPSKKKEKENQRTHGKPHRSSKQKAMRIPIN